MRTLPAWIRRFQAPVPLFPNWARYAPHRLVFASNHEGGYQLYSRDLTGPPDLVRLTDSAVGVMSGRMALDGESVFWFDDPSGDETGRWRSTPFAGGESFDLVGELEPAWPQGFGQAPGLLAMGRSTRDGYSIVVVGDGLRELESGPEPRSLAAISHDGGLLAIGHSVGEDYLHPGLRVRAASGEVVLAIVDPGAALRGVGFAPLAGDSRLLIEHEPAGVPGAAIVDAAGGRRRALGASLPGEVEPLGWWPDGGSVLLRQSQEGRDQLYRLHLDDDRLEAIEHPGGTISNAAVRPDGEVWIRHSSGATPWTVMTSTGVAVLTAGEPAPSGVPYRSWHFSNPAGDRVHGFIADAPGPGPKPVLMWVHGGPHYQYGDWFMPEVQAWVDHGVSVAMVNYRGSTGYGSAWRDHLIGNPGFPEVEDVVAGLDDLIGSGSVKPEQVIVGGRSWGGYITLLAAGLHPGRWAVALATVPVADYEAAFEDEGPDLQAMDRQLFGGDPATAPGLYRERSPLTYADRVTAPLLIIAGDNDIRCPIRQILNYADALARRGAPFELYRYSAGHGSMLTQERVRQMQLQLDYAFRQIPGARQSPGAS